MTAFFVYMLKVSCWIAVWWIIYFLFLRKERFFIFNRIYLITGLVASFLIPLLRFYYPVEIFITQYSTSTIAENNQASIQHVDLFSVLFYFYIICVTIFIVRQLLLLLKIGNRIRSAGFMIVDNCRIVDSQEAKIPFSFYRYIFLNFRQNISEREKQLILAHERSHIFQRHWIDLIIAESICIILWFNPFMWIYLHSIKENHEFLADEAVISNGYSPVSYSAALINQSLNIPVFSLVNSFAYYKFKRLFMMKKETSNPLKKLAVLLLIPIAGFFFRAFAEPEYIITTIDNPSKFEDSLKFMPPLVLPSFPSITIEEQQQQNDPSSLVWHTTSFYVDTCRDIVNNHDSIFIQQGKAKSALVIIDGEESSVSNKKLDPKQIESVSILKDSSAKALYGEKGENGVVLITTKKIDNSPQDPVIDKEQKRFYFSNNRLYTTCSSDNKSPLKIRGLNMLRSSSPLIIIDGEETAYSLEELDPEQIESISVLKDASATTLYGEKSKNGLILITTKTNINNSLKSSARNMPKNKRIMQRRAIQGSSPLIIIDGEESSIPLETLDKEQIESFTVQKNASTFAVYGEKGKNGVVLITTKKNKKKSSESSTSDKNNFKKFLIRGISLNESPLIIIDGEESSGSFDDINPEQVESVSVLKGESATKIYGEKGKNSVILITTKKDF